MRKYLLLFASILFGLAIFPTLLLGHQRLIVADKVTKGRTAGEKVYEYVVPANEWVETSLNIYPNQELLIHHFTSNELVQVKIGSFSGSRLEKAGTVLPLYTSKNCSSDRPPNARVTYTCVQVSRSSGIRFFVRKSTRVGDAVKNR